MKQWIRFLASAAVAGTVLCGAVFAEHTGIKNTDDSEKAQALQLLEVMNGDENGNLNLDAPVTRAEFVKMLTALFDVKASGGADFADVPADAWYAEAVCAATQNGLVFGADGKFLPQDNISRQDAAVIIYRLCGGAGGNAQFGDYAEIADYAKEAVSSLAAAGIIAGSDGNFYPGNTLTRAEAAVILCKAYDMGVGR